MAALITQACNQKSDYKPIADSDRFLDADFRKISQKIPSRTNFSEIENLDFMAINWFYYNEDKHLFPKSSLLAKIGDFSVSGAKKRKNEIIFKLIIMLKKFGLTKFT